MQQVLLLQGMMDAGSLTGVLAAQAKGGAAAGPGRSRAGRGQQPGGQAGATAALADTPPAAQHAAGSQRAQRCTR